MSTTETWHVAPGDPALVVVPSLAKPIRCGNAWNAKLVARAVNSHADLVASLTASLKWLEHPAVHNAFRSDPTLYGLLQGTIEHARAAVAKAKPCD